ncbi:hypothetical protein, partial [Nocardioides sp.]|uniref:hypothetical protein n=1 Tax=Nocardioides sp. TaxID=35761 RepID=UPI00356A830B
SFRRITVRPSSGGITRIVRSGTGVHVSGVRLDGLAHEKTWLSLTSRRSMRTVSIATTDAPEPAWGTQAGAAPPSYP